MSFVALEQALLLKPRFGKISATVQLTHQSPIPYTEKSQCAALQVLVDSISHQPQPAWPVVKGDESCSLETSRRLCVGYPCLGTWLGGEICNLEETEPMAPGSQVFTEDQSHASVCFWLSKIDIPSSA